MALLYGDAFYTYGKDPVSGSPINITPNTAGGARIDNNAITIYPPFNPNGEYDVTLEDFNGTGGTGSVLALVFLDADYTDNDPNLLTFQICGTNAGS